MPEPASAGPLLTERAVRTLVEQWYSALDRHRDPDEVKRFLIDDGLELHFPEGVFRGHAGFADWYEAAVHRFFDEEHTVLRVRAAIDGAEAEVRVNVNWQARVWKAPTADSQWLGFDADQTWTVVAGEDGRTPLIKTYTCNALEPMPGSAAL
jgi:hypothetical protein